MSQVNLSSVTGFQQAMLFVLMLVGDFTFVSWIMGMLICTGKSVQYLRRETVLVRKHFFTIRCRELIEAHTLKLKRIATQRSMNRTATKHSLYRHGTFTSVLRRNKTIPIDPEAPSSEPKLEEETNGDNSGHLHLRLQRTRTQQGYQEAAASFNCLPQESNLRFHASPTVHHYIDPHLYADRLPRKHRGFGGFPSPVGLLRQLLETYLPATHRRLSKTLTLNASPTHIDPDTTPWLDFKGLSVGRNSKFNE